MGAGGRILPRQKLFVSPMAIVYGSQRPLRIGSAGPVRLGDQSGQLTESPFGSNMAFRKEVFEKYGVFELTGAHDPAAKFAVRTREFGNRLLAGENVYDTNPPRSFITRSQRTESRKSTIWRGGSIRAVPIFGSLAFGTTPLRFGGFRYTWFAVFPSGLYVGW